MKFFLSPFNSKVRSLFNFQRLKQLLGVMFILLAIVFGQTVLVEKFGFRNVVYAQVQCCTPPAIVTFVGGNTYCSLHAGTGIPTNCSGATPSCDVVANQCIPVPDVANPQCCTPPAIVTFVGGNTYCSLHAGTGIPTNCSGGCDVETNRCIDTGGSTIPVYDPTCSSGTSYYGYTGVKTALGCLPTDPQTFINTATPWAVGIGAGIAFLLGIFGSGMIVLSAGNPEKMQAGKEMITSAITGLLLIIFAVFILRIIGVDVLKLF